MGIIKAFTFGDPIASKSDMCWSWRLFIEVVVVSSGRCITRGGGFGWKGLSGR